MNANYFDCFDISFVCPFHVAQSSLTVSMFHWLEWVCVWGGSRREKWSNSIISKTDRQNIIGFAYFGSTIRFIFHLKQTSKKLVSAFPFVWNVSVSAFGGEQVDGLGCVCVYLVCNGKKEIQTRTESLCLSFDCPLRIKMTKLCFPKKKWEECGVVKK